MIADDVKAHEDTTTVLLSVAASKQETALFSLISGIVTRYASLAKTVESRVNLHESSVEVHELYRDEYRRCQEMIDSDRQRLQQIHDGSSVGIAAVRQQMDQLKVVDCFVLAFCTVEYYNLAVVNFCKVSRRKCLSVSFIMVILLYNYFIRTVVSAILAFLTFGTHGLYMQDGSPEVWWDL